MALDPVAQQQDFSLGAFQSGAAEREPEGAAETIVGLLGSDGLPYKRGGTTYKSNAALGSDGLLWLVDAYLAGGRRTVFGNATTARVLDVDDATPLNPNSSAMSLTRPVRPVVLDSGYLMVPNADTATEWFVYGGSRKTSDYNTGTMTVTEGSVDVVGVGTTWAANVDPGMILEPGFVPVGHVNSNTSLTLAVPYPYSTAAGVASKLHPWGAPGAAWYSPHITRMLPFGASIAGRFVVASADDPAALWFSEQNTPLTILQENFHAFHGSIRGFGVLRDVLVVFTTEGVHAVSGMAYPLVDPGSGDPLQRNELVNADLVAWGHEGIASWEGALIVPALDGVYLMDSLGAPQRISDRIEDLYLSYVRAGYVPGVAEVYNGHYFLPILNPASVSPSYGWVDTLVCRLQPSHSGNNFAWTQLIARAAAFAERQTVPPLLLAASRQSTSRVLDCSAFFTPASAVKLDADGTAPDLQLVTIDYPTGNMVSNFVHKVRLVYELTDAASDNPTITAEASVDGAAYTTLSGVAAEASPGEKRWRVNRHAKNVRFRFLTTAAAASCKVKSVEVFVRHSGKQ